MPSRTHALEHLDHNRRWVHPDGIWRADVVFVPLEDGDRCQALVRGGRQVITIDLNPLSRTAQTATVTIVDHLLRALPLLTAACENPSPPSSSFDNAALLRQAVTALRSGVG